MPVIGLTSMRDAMRIRSWRHRRAAWEARAVEACRPSVRTIGSMVLNPGDTTTILMRFMMHGDMGGPHDFRVHIPNSDPHWGERTLKVVSEWVMAGPWE